MSERTDTRKVKQRKRQRRGTETPAGWPSGRRRRGGRSCGAREATGWGPGSRGRRGDRQGHVPPGARALPVRLGCVTDVGASLRGTWKLLAARQDWVGTPLSPGPGPYGRAVLQGRLSPHRRCPGAGPGLPGPWGPWRAGRSVGAADFLLAPSFPCGRTPGRPALEVWDRRHRGFMSRLSVGRPGPRTLFPRQGQFTPGRRLSTLAVIQNHNRTQRNTSLCWVPVPASEVSLWGAGLAPGLKGAPRDPSSQPG